MRYPGLVITLMLLVSALSWVAADNGRYLGAFIEEDPTFRGDIAAFERAVGAPFSFHPTYRAYGKPFPCQWAERMTAAQRGLMIFWEPWGSGRPLELISRDEYLVRWAGTLSRCTVPVLLVFGSEPNIDQDGMPVPYDEFRQAFREVATVMRRMAPSVEMVFSLARPGVIRAPGCSALYYPGDEYVDWVGFTTYDNGNAQAWSDLEACLSWAQARWPTKALALTEVGCDRLFPGTGDRLLSFLQRTVDRYPQLRLINYFSLDAGDRPLNPKPVYYRLAPDSEAMAAMRWAAASGKFKLGPPPRQIASFRASCDDDPYMLRWEVQVALYSALPPELTGRDMAQPVDPRAATAWLKAKRIVLGYPDGHDRANEAVLGYELVLMVDRALRLYGRDLGTTQLHPLEVSGEATAPRAVRAALASLVAKGLLRESSEADLNLGECVRQSTCQELLARLGTG